MTIPWAWLTAQRVFITINGEQNWFPVTVILPYRISGTSERVSPGHSVKNNRLE